MSKIFIAQREKRILASFPHPPNTEYRISIGIEKWSNDRIVAKVQMVYDGKISGRKAPSYPIGTDDFERVTKAMKELIEGK